MTHHPFRRRASCLVSLAAFVPAAPSLAATVQWSNPFGGIFSAGENWTGGSPPGPADRAQFLGVSPDVTFMLNAMNDRLSVRDGDVEFILGGHTYTLTSASLTSVQVGFLDGDEASLVIRGGTVAARESAIGVFTGSSGEVVVSGAGARFEHTGSIVVGDSGAAALTAQNGGIITYGDRCFVGLNGGADADLIITGAGSRLIGVGQLSVGPAEPVGSLADGAPARGVGGALPTRGTLTALNSGSVEVGSVQVGPAGVATGNGVIRSPVQSQGVVRPGAGVGLLRIEGAYTQTSPGVLDVQIGGPAAGTQHDVLQITGSATLGGALSISLANGFTPTAGQTFVILTAGSRSGMFQSVGGPAAGQFIVSYGPSSVTLTAGQAGNGADINGDGVVNAQDLGMLLGAWGPSTGPSDLNNDGVVNATDLALLLTSWS